MADGVPDSGAGIFAGDPSLFFQILEMAPDAIVIADQHGSIVLANRHTEQVFGYQPNELIGQSVEVLIPERAREHHVGLRQAYVSYPGVRPMGRGLELWGRRKDGSEIPVEISLSPLKLQTGVLVTSVIRDVTERNRAEELLRLQAVALESAANAIVITDREGIIRWVNPAFSTFTGYSREEVVGRHTRILKSGAHDREYYRQMWETILAGEVWHGETINRDCHGRVYTEEQMIAPVRDGHDTITHFVAVKQDISARREAEDLRETLVRMMVHDLRHPLTIVQGAVEMLAGVNEQKENEWALDAMARASTGMLSLVNSILECEKLKAGQMPLDRSRFDVGDLIDHMLRLQAPAALAKKQNLSADCPQDLPPLFADRVLVERALQNLVANAIKFTPEQGSIRISVARSAQDIVVSVADNGPGISDEERKKLFRAFGTGRHKNRGSGLGLAFCRLAVEAHGGGVRVESEVGKGSTFLLSLPACSETHFRKPE